MNAKILNVDDREVGRYIRTQILRQAGFTVIEASTGAEALTRFETDDAIHNQIFSSCSKEKLMRITIVWREKGGGDEEERTNRKETTRAGVPRSQSAEPRKRRGGGEGFWGRRVERISKGVG